VYSIAEHEALCELRETVPSICPYSAGHGKYANSPGYFLLMEWLEVVGREEKTAEGGSGLSLPQKLAQLHKTPAKAPPGHQDPIFGWHRPTYCGSTKQSNTFRASWAKFYAENRLLTILQQIDESHGTDQELRAGVKAIAEVVVPRLLGNGHLGGRRGITPVLIHGDLWHGNKAYGLLPAWDTAEDVVFDPSACYCHSEFEIGIMRIFGGFSAGFFHEYHRMVPQTEPIHEYEDRIQLYML
jgi:protein-ribulosamine 3-kinase